MLTKKPARKPTARNPAENFRSHNSFPIVAMGGSAGGLEAHTRILSQLPERPNMAFVVIQHLDPKYPSMLTQLLSQHSRMPVLQVKKGMRIQPNHVYVIPPNKNIVLEDGTLNLLSRRESNGLHMPIDFFMRSLAEVQRSGAIGVVLSGTATDGTLGLQAIKAENGITFAQDEKSAKFGGMPHSAASSGFADLVLPPENIAAELVKIGQQNIKPTLPASSQNDAFESILVLLRSSHHVDFSGYKPTTLQRRISRRMALQKIGALEAYANLLAKDPLELKALFNDCLITVTNFFRDPDTFKALRRFVFPKLLNKRMTSDPIRIWVPGCSTGEEVYSLAIALFEYLEEKRSIVPVQIFGTDISERALNVARSGSYIENISMDVSTERLRKFFTKLDKHYVVIKSIRESCIFSQHDITKDPPFSRIDLISCRNLLIYLNPEMHRRIMPMFHYGLKPLGFLSLGSSESIGGFGHLFGLVNKEHKIFAKKTAAVRPQLNFSGQNHLSGKTMTQPKASVEVEAGDIYRDADRVLLNRIGIASILIDSDFETLQFRGEVHGFLEIRPGKPSHNLLKIVKEGLALHLRAAVQKCKKTGLAGRREGIQIKWNGSFKEITIEVIPVRSRGAKAAHYLVLLEDRSSEMRNNQKNYTPLKRSQQEREMIWLKDEMSSLRDDLQASIEDLEAGNEKLKVANEEILSSNEELQSTNEELETAKEELQSTNEEMNTVNEELQSRNLLLTQLNNDITNFLNSANLPIVMVGNDLRVRRFTPMASAIFNLISSDVGRPIVDIKPNFQVPRLDSIITTCIDTVTAYEQEVMDKDGRWYNVMVRPYRTSENKIDGAVIVLFDITRRKKSTQEIVGLNKQLTERAKELEKSNVELEQFAYAASHDLQEPLRQVSNFVDLLGRESKNSTPASERYLEHILKGTLQMQHLIKNLLSFSQTLKKFEMQPADLNQTLSQVMENLGDAIRKSEAKVHWEPLPTVIADPSSMVQLFQNLIGNAIKYRKKSEAPNIQVNARFQDGEWIISVSDNGIGIEPKYAKRIFGIYQRLHTGKEIPGTGIGLAICKKIAERHGGRIWVESEPNKGSTFSVALKAKGDHARQNV